MAVFKNFLFRVINILDEINLKYVIIGGVAAIIRGRVRTTNDLDLIVENRPDKLKLFFDALKSHQFDILDKQISYALKEEFNISIFDKKSILRIDLKIAKTHYELIG